MADEASDRWPAWALAASRGDLIRVAVYQRSVNVQLGSALLALMDNDRKAAMECWRAYLAANDDLERLINEIGGE